jgi:hypothetical protein
MTLRENSAGALWSSCQESRIAADVTNDTISYDRVTWDLGKSLATNNSDAGPGSPEFSEAEPLLEPRSEESVMYGVEG